MVGGALIVGLCLIILGWTSELVDMFVSNTDLKKPCTIALAVLSIYAVDFAINAVQSSCRSLIVDTLPISKQQLGSAWASRMIGVGHLVGYAIGTMDLPSIFGKALGDSQLKQLCLIAAVFFLLTVGITCYAVDERILVSAKDTEVRSSAMMTISTILKTTMNLPDRIQAICWIQFWAWIGEFPFSSISLSHNANGDQGWFPFLFYGATWVGEVYFRYHPEVDAKNSADVLGDIGRIGSLSLVVFSIITFVASIGLPMVIRSPASPSAKLPPHRVRNFTPRPPPFLRPIFDLLLPFLRPLAAYVPDKKPDLLTAWQYSHFIFAFAMALAPFVRSLGMATVLVSLCGIPWAIACWAPFAFMGVEINRLTGTNGGAGAVNSSYRRLSSSSTVVDDYSSPPSSPTMLRLNHLDREIEDGDPASTGETAGVYLGILNLFTTLPQFVGTFISMAVFSILEPGTHPELHQDGSSTEGDAKEEPPSGVNAIAVCLFIGALSALGAAYATRSMARGIKG